MTTLTFDTLEAARTLRGAGVDEKTAEAIVAVVQRTTQLPDISHLATREQVEALRSQVSTLQTLMFTLFGMNIAAVVGMSAFLYTVLKHA